MFALAVHTVAGIIRAMIRWGSRIGVCLSLAAVCALRPPALAAAPMTAILGIEAVDDSTEAKKQNETADLAKRLTDALRVQATSDTLRIPLTSATRDIVEIKLLDGCDENDASCFAKVGRDLGAKQLVLGALKRQKEGGFGITLRLLDVDAQSISRTAVDVLGATALDGASLRKAAGKLLGDLMGVAPSGSVIITTSETISGTVLVDGKERGEIIDGQLVVGDLLPGIHRVEIEAQGYEPWSGSVEVAPGQRASVSAELVEAGQAVGPTTPRVDDDEIPHPDAGRPGGTYRILFWTSLTATVATAAGFTITGLQVRNAESTKNDLIRQSQTDDDPSNDIDTTGDACSQADQKNFTELSDVCSEGKSKAKLTNILIGATALLGVASAFFYYKGYVSSKRASKDAQLDARRRVRFTPEVFARGNGAALTAEFKF